MKKLTLLAGVGVGYVLGSKAGRGRYEQIKSKAQQAWEDPRVQEKTAAAQDLVAQNAPKVAEKAQQVASDLTAKMAGATSGDDSSWTDHAAAPGQHAAAVDQDAPTGRLP